eukprot:GGOE01029521.1.p4 GENE.GGOE01029521.1~~GGOE01029521.1.p4  ORF type:complete len:123 (-),score=1.00 GGOE01029521.1:1232-1600(-)
MSHGMCHQVGPPAHGHVPISLTQLYMPNHLASCGILATSYVFQGCPASDLQHPDICRATFPASVTSVVLLCLGCQTLHAPIHRHERLVMPSPKARCVLLRLQPEKTCAEGRECLYLSSRRPG